MSGPKERKKTNRWLVFKPAKLPCLSPPQKVFDFLLIKKKAMQVVFGSAFIDQDACIDVGCRLFAFFLARKLRLRSQLGHGRIGYFSF
ncbi:MAG: hypothetical protein IKQ36_04730 [Clostridia bacterium]|nr:hypothetical protein [Clostridia bacterium]